jgi:predicted RNA-binding protein YlxR (DUF448 family)
LIRIVRTPEGSVEIDLKGKRSGRGAYVCRRQQCYDTALQAKKLSIALKGELKSEDVAALRALVGPLLVAEVAAEPVTNPILQNGAGYED